MTTILQNDGEILDNNISSISDFFQLMKPRVMSLVIFTALIGYFCGVFSTETILNPYLSMIGILAIALGAGSSGVLNQWYDREVDSMMERTKNRPIPKGKIEPSDALAFGLIGSILSIVILGLCINWLAGFLLFFTIIFYAVFYTIFLKRYSYQNIVIGGASGAFPPVIGYVCSTGSFGVEALILFGIIFLWTPPHFWSLALVNKSDYIAAKIPMLPIIYGDITTRKNIFIYSLLLMPCAYLPWILNYSGNFYAIVVTLLNIEFIRRSISVLKENKDSEKGLFVYSIFYLSILFASICFDKFISNFIIG